MKTITRRNYHITFQSFWVVFIWQRKRNTFSYYILALLKYMKLQVFIFPVLYPHFPLHQPSLSHERVSFLHSAHPYSLPWLIPTILQLHCKPCISFLSVLPWSSYAVGYLKAAVDIIHFVMLLSLAVLTPSANITFLSLSWIEVHDPASCNFA